MSDKLTGFSCSLNNNCLYVVGFGTVEDVKADDLTLFDNNNDIISKKELATVVVKDDITINGILHHNSDKIATLLLENSDILITKYNQIIVPDYTVFNIDSEEDLKIRLRYDNRVSYKIKTDIFSDFRINQRVVINSNLPYDLEDIPSFKISFQNQETPRIYNEYSRRMSEAAMLQMSSSPITEIGLPIECGPIDILPKNSTIEVPLANSATQLEILEYYFQYNITDNYTKLQVVVKSNKGNVYPSLAIVNDGYSLPILEVPLSLRSEGVNFVVDMGNHPSIIITNIKQVNSYELTVNFSEDITLPFKLQIKGDNLVQNYEVTINEKNQKVKVEIEQPKN